MLYKNGFISSLDVGFSFFIFSVACRFICSTCTPDDSHAVGCCAVCKDLCHVVC